MKLEFNFDMEDWMSFQEYFLLQSNSFKQSKAIATYILPLSLIGFYLWHLQKDGFSLIMTLFCSIPSILSFLYTPQKFTQSSLNNIQKMLENGDNSGLIGFQTVTFTLNHITLEEPGATQQITWNGIKKIVTTDNYYFLFNTAISAVIIPKRKIDSKLTQLDSFLQENFNELFQP